MVKEQNQKRWEGLEEAKYIFVSRVCSKRSVAQRGAWLGESRTQKKKIQGRATQTRE
jgi:hypothetical protein